MKNAEKTRLSGDKSLDGKNRLTEKCIQRDKNRFRKMEQIYLVSNRGGSNFVLYGKVLRIGFGFGFMERFWSRRVGSSSLWS